jgi:hypothetical protein
VEKRDILQVKPAKCPVFYLEGCLQGGVETSHPRANGWVALMPFRVIFGIRAIRPFVKFVLEWVGLDY